MTRPVAERSRTSARLPVAARDRRPALAALALLLIVAGALGAGLVVYRNGQRSDVLVAAHEIKAGEQVTASDFGTARVAADSGSVVNAASESNFIGSYAITDVPAGTLINNQMFQAGRVMPRDGVVVSVTPSTQNAPPTGSIVTGSVVRAYYTPSSVTTGSQLPPGSVLVNAARVVDTMSSTTSNSQTFSLLVSSDEAKRLVAVSAEGSVTLALLPVGTKPDIDFEKTS